ncbi:MAG: hypothetical protein DMG13_34155 [Acidobacteria bacterium]|nr:MAG: hypothetical protein DMG13_34155 [Acidobacteriota bacterium]
MLDAETSTRSWASMLRISKSQIQTYLICPRKFWFQYFPVTGATPEFTPASLPFGAALHAAIATFYRSVKETGAKPGLASVTHEFEVEWEKEVSGRRVSFQTRTLFSAGPYSRSSMKRYIRGMSRGWSIRSRSRYRIRTLAIRWTCRSSVS